MTQILTIELTEAEMVVIIFGIIASVLALATFIIWNDLFRHQKKKKKR